MFGPDDAMPLVSPSSRSARSRDGRPENCPNHIVSLLRTPLSGGIPLDQGSCRCTRFILSVSCLQQLGLRQSRCCAQERVFDCSLLLAVIGRRCWLFLAVTFSPQLSKSQRFRGRDQKPGCFFCGIISGISGGSGDWSTKSPISRLRLPLARVEFEGSTHAPERTE